MVYVSMLRGINVSGQKKIVMADLVSLYELLGFKNVSTYIQSGNVLFSTGKTSAKALSGQIGGAIEEKYGFTVPVTIRTSDQLGKIISANPFLIRKNIDLTKLHVTFIESKPDAEMVKSVESTDSNADEICAMGSEIYLYCPGGYGKTRFSNTFLERKLKQSATTRNWKTVNTLYEMCDAD